jgi:hypothetical protein
MRVAALPRLASVALPSACEAVQATRFAGGFADLDRFAHRRLLAYHILLVSDRGHRAASRTKRIWRPLATPTRRSHPEGIEAKRRSGKAA